MASMKKIENDLSLSCEFKENQTVNECYNMKNVNNLTTPPPVQPKLSLIDCSISLPSATVDIRKKCKPSKNSKKIFFVGDVVEVQARTWPGINKPGGVGKVVKYNSDGTYDVNYVLGGSEKKVDPRFIKEDAFFMKLQVQRLKKERDFFFNYQQPNRTKHKDKKDRGTLPNQVISDESNSKLSMIPSSPITKNTLKHKLERTPETLSKTNQKDYIEIESIQSGSISPIPFPIEFSTPIKEPFPKKAKITKLFNFNQKKVEETISTPCVSSKKKSSYSKINHDSQTISRSKSIEESHCITPKSCETLKPSIEKTVQLNNFPIPKKKNDNCSIIKLPETTSSVINSISSQVTNASCIKDKQKDQVSTVKNKEQKKIILRNDLKKGSLVLRRGGMLLSNPFVHTLLDNQKNIRDQKQKKFSTELKDLKQKIISSILQKYSRSYYDLIYSTDSFQNRIFRADKHWRPTIRLEDLNVQDQSTILSKGYHHYDSLIEHIHKRQCLEAISLQQSQQADLLKTCSTFTQEQIEDLDLCPVITVKLFELEIPIQSH